jgi:ABC-type nickel/cobalt efflux system permease component RcnA
MRLPLAFLLALLVGSLAFAHPMPRRLHDRTIKVHLTAHDNHVEIVVDYRLEVDPFTAVFDDLTAILDKDDFKKLRQPQEFYQAFVDNYAPILSGNLLAKLDDRPLELRCRRKSFTLRDENGTDLLHLRCDFVFYAEVATELSGPPSHHFRFREGNYELEEGRIALTLDSATGVRIESKSEPDDALKARPATELRPGDDAELRQASATFVLEKSISAPPDGEPAASAEPDNVPTPKTLHSLLDSKQGIALLLCLAAVFGAAHALTPGHGKTLVAAYLVGERGTIGHALFLGLVTTITHTGAVLILSAVLYWLFPGTVPGDIQVALGLVGGLLVAGMGFWLLLRRLTGGADHIHIGGGHHHHHEPAATTTTDVGWLRLTVLGISGGIVPCWDAILMLGFAITAQRLWLGLPLLLAFSAGLASVLIAIGMAVVCLKGFASSRWGESRLVRSLPLVSAGLVTMMGLWLCYDTMHP